MRGYTRAGLGVAAVLLVAVALWVVLHPSAGEQVLSTHPGERATVQLPDGSEVVLNASSQLVYDPAAFADGRRHVRVDGEAFLSVARTPDTPRPGFRVETPDGTVRVLGTRFSVTSRDGDTRVVLDEGRVAVDTRAADRDTTVHMEPGDLVQFDRETGRIERRLVNPRVYSSWTSGTLVFDETPVAEVVDRIEATFNVEVVVEDPAVFDRTVSGSVENDLPTIVSGLSQILDRPIDRRGDRVVIR